MLDTLNYKFKMKADITKAFQVVENESLKYFQQNNPNLMMLKKDDSIGRLFNTKMGSATVKGKVTISELEKDALLQMTTVYSKGEIVQTYKFIRESHQETNIIYSEKNTFHNTRNQFGFIFIGFLYKFFYNRGIKKRMRYLEQLAGQ